MFLSALGFTSELGAEDKSNPTTALATSTGESVFPDLHLSIISSAIRPIRSIRGELSTTETALIQVLQRIRDSQRGGSELDDAKVQEEIEAVETFIRDNPSSPYTPSLRIEMGKYYRARGGALAALDHWEKAEKMLAGNDDKVSRSLQDEVLARKTYVLVHLARVPDLKEIYRTNPGRSFETVVQGDLWTRGREKLAKMEAFPEWSFRCGVYAIQNVALSWLGRDFPIAGLEQEPATKDGLSLYQVERLCQKYQVPLVAVQRTVPGLLPVPSIVHWVGGHFSAILQEKEGQYLVADPTWGVGNRWLTARDINREASGYFMIPAELKSKGFGNVSLKEAQSILGKTVPCPPVDANDRCKKSGASGSRIKEMGAVGPKQNPIQEKIEEQKERPGQSCDALGRCFGGSGIVGGMPTWRVSQPFLNVWYDDLPLVYYPSKGPEVAIQITYKQRASVEIGNTRLGKRWFFPWLSKARINPIYGNEWQIEDATGNITPFTPSTSGALLSNPDSREGTVFQRTVDGGGATTGAILHFPNGSKYVYTAVISGETAYRMITKIVDPVGNELTFNYTADGRLTSIVDADGQTTTVNSTVNPDGFYRISSIVAPNSASVGFAYDYQGNLVSITDAAGIVSQLTYTTDGWPLTLKTPYGTTQFAHNELGYNRWVKITLPDGATEAYALFGSGAPTPITGTPAYSANQKPTVPGPPNFDFADANRTAQISVYWDSKQFGDLGTSIIENFQWNQLRRGQITRWHELNWHVDSPPIYVQEPAPCLVANDQGIITWFDFPNKSSNNPYLAPDPMTIDPTTIARVMPDGTTWYKSMTYNSRTMMTSSTENWVESEIGKSRTWTYQYDAATGQDLEKTYAPGNILVEENNYASGHPHLPAWTKNRYGEQTTYAYEAGHRILSISYPNGRLTTYAYGAPGGRLSSVTDTVGATTVRSESFTWLNGYLRTHTDYLGYSRTFDYDFLGRLKKITHPDTTTEEFTFTLWPGETYPNSTGGTSIIDLTGLKDRRGNWTKYRYDGRQRLNQITDPKLYVTKYEYCGCGSASKETLAFGTADVRVTDYLFDNQGNITTINRPGSVQVLQTFDALKRKVSYTDSQATENFVYDNASRLITVQRQGLSVLARTYDMENRVLTSTDARGITTTMTYGGASPVLESGRLKTRSIAGATAETFLYTPNKPGPTTYTSPIGKQTTYDYDTLGRKITETQVGVYTLGYQYDAAGNLRYLTDGRGKVTQWVYNSEGQLWKKFYPSTPAAESLRYTYYAGGLLNTRYSVAKGTTTYSYDNNDNLTLVDYPASTDLTYAYDALNRLKTMTDASGTTTYQYHVTGGLEYEDGPWPSTRVTYNYNTSTGRRRSSMSLNLPAAWSQSYVYDNQRRLTTSVTPSGTYTYNYYAGTPSPLVDSLTLPSTLSIDLDYDARKRLSYTQIKYGATAINSTSYPGYNDANQRVQTYRWLTTGISEYNNYGYDNAGQVTSSTTTYPGGGSNPSEVYGFTYDAAANLVNRAIGSSATAFSVDDDNRLVTGQMSPYSHDGNGNLTSYGPGTYVSYDDENQLSSIVAGTKTDMVYDGRSRLRARKSYTWNGSAWVYQSELRYVYDGMQVVQERDGANTVLVTYTRGNDLSGTLGEAGGIGGLLARSDSAGHLYYHADGNGNIQTLVNNTGGVAAWYKYGPFGTTLASGGASATANVMRFSSKELRNGLYYYGYRFYEPNLQRWLNRDPLGEAGGVNLYEFGLNRPTGVVDTDGRFPIELAPILFEPPPLAPRPQIPPELIAEALRLNRLRHRVELPDGRAVDLKGADHGGVETPHTHCPRPPNSPPYQNFPPNPKFFPMPRPSTLDDISDVLNFLRGTIKQWFDGFFIPAPSLGVA